MAPHRYPGDALAKAFVEQYSTPQALRTAWTTQGLEAILPHAFDELSWTGDWGTVGGMRDELTPRDAATLLSIIAAYAADFTLW